MDSDCIIGCCCVHRVQLPPHKRRISGMGGCSHRLFQGILQVHLQDCLLPAGSSDIVLYPQPSGFLITSSHETDIPYIFL